MYGCTYIRTDRVTLNAPGIVMGGGGGGGGGGGHKNIKHNKG